MNGRETITDYHGSAGAQAQHAVVCTTLFFPPLRGLIPVWERGILRDDSHDDGKGAVDATAVWLFEHFRRKFAREGTRGSFAPRSFSLSHSHFAPPTSLPARAPLFVRAACRAFRPIRGSLARLKYRECFQSTFENADGPRGETGWNESGERAWERRKGEGAEDGEVKEEQSDDKQESRW